MFRVKAPYLFLNPTSSSFNKREFSKILTQRAQQPYKKEKNNRRHDYSIPH